MSLPPTPPTAATFDADGRIAVDAPCVDCGYNLRTLALGGACPECGHPIGHSLGGYFLPHAPAGWVRGLARGLLLALIAAGAMFLVVPFVSLSSLFPLLAVRRFVLATDPAELARVLSVPHVVCRVIAVAAGIYAVVLLTRRDPALLGRPERLTARRVLRAVCWLAPLLELFNLVTVLVMRPTPAFTPGEKVTLVANFFGPTFVRFVVMGIVTGVLAIGVYLVGSLALLRHIGALMRRARRSGLARFARIEFWGLLTGGVMLVLGYAIILPNMLSMMTAMRSTMTAAGRPAASISSTTQPCGPPFGVNASNVTIPSSTSSTKGRPPPGWQARYDRLIANISTGCYCLMVGLVATAGFGSAGIVLLVLACVALFKAAREAAENAGLPAPPPPVEYGGC